MRQLVWIVGAGALALGGCTKQTQVRETAGVAVVRAPEQAAPAGDAQESLDMLILQADGSQPGRLRDLRADVIVVEPYQVEADPSVLGFSNEVPVFRGDEQVSLRSLQPGADVRVFYRMPEGAEQSEVVAVQLLDPQEARAIERAVRNAPAAPTQEHHQMPVDEMPANPVTPDGLNGGGPADEGYDDSTNELEPRP